MDRVKLNVGGTKFETSVSTLMNYPDSMLARMFSPERSESVKQDTDGSVFIDRDPELFRKVLNVYRNLTIPDVDEEFQNELQFFCLDSLYDKVVTKVKIFVSDYSVKKVYATTTYIVTETLICVELSECSGLVKVEIIPWFAEMKMSSPNKVYSLDGWVNPSEIIHDDYSKIFKNGEMSTIDKVFSRIHLCMPKNSKYTIRYLDDRKFDYSHALEYVKSLCIYW